MGIRERRERERAGTREKILDAARDLFVAEGYDGVTMRKVAEKIEYSPTAIYVHFANKEELFRELCQADFDRLAHTFRAIAQIEDPGERLRRAGLAYVEFGVKYPNHYRLMFMTPHPHPVEPYEHQCEKKGNPEEDAYAFLKLVVTDALRAGLFRREMKDVELIAQTLWAGMHGVVALEVSKQTDHWVEWRSLKKRAEFMIDALVYGLMQQKKKE